MSCIKISTLTPLKYIFFVLSHSTSFLVLICFFYAQAAQAVSPIEQLEFSDPALLNCIQKSARGSKLHAIAEFKKLRCHGMNIQSLEGLNQLTNLTSLSLYNNELTEVDLRVLKQLVHVNIANNKLRAVKISGLSRLKSLYLFKNKLTTVNFIGLKQLKKIRITNNQLITLDISPLVSLEKAYFFDNKLENLVLTGLSQLKFVEVRQNPMPDDVYDRYDAIDGITIVHDGNADDWK
ncbi:MAG: hypothetical protein HRT52_05840 [Colwellia sp.]|nr:hypothetical protein [Colwellia sp.]